MISRTALDGLPLEKVEKDKLASIIRRLSEGYVVEVLGFAVMGNHFHLLVEVSPATMVCNDEVQHSSRLLYDDEAKFSEKRMEDYRKRFGSLSAYTRTSSRAFPIFSTGRKSAEEPFGESDSKA